MDRRSFLVGGGVAVAGVATGPAYAQYFDNAWLKPPLPQPLAPADIQSAVARLRKQFLAEFDAAYVENVIVPHFLVSVYDGERPFLPMIGEELTKENALPYDLWGLLSETWKPAPQDGVTVFLQGLDKRGPDNRRKRIYMTALTPDLYRPMYGDKVVQFFDKLLGRCQCRQAVDAALSRKLFRPLLGPAFGRQGRCSSGSRA